jgi:hypothetical protein
LAGCRFFQPEPVNKKSLAPFIQTLKDKNQTGQQQIQALDVISMFYHMKKKKMDQDK